MSEDAKLVDYLKWVTADLRQTRDRLREVEAGRQAPVADPPRPGPADEGKS